MRLASLMTRARTLFPLRGASIAALLVSTAAGAQTGTISGTITEKSSGQPVTTATVTATRVGGGGGTAHSRDNGTFSIANLAAGTYSVSVLAMGLAPNRTDNVVVRAGQTTTLEIVFAPAVRTLEQMVTTAAGVTAPERIQDSQSQISIVTTKDIAQTPSASITDVLKAVPGLSISTGGIAQANIVSRGFNNAFSTQMLMLQDYRYAGVPSLRVNVPLLFTGTNEDIDHIEVLQGPAAALYGPNSGNGVLHVITKSPFNSVGTTLTLDGGERSMLRGSLRHAGVIVDNKLGYKLSGEYLTAKDWEYIDPNEPTVYPANDTRIPVERRGKPVTHDFDLTKYSGEARVDFRPSENTQLISTAGLSGIGNAREITTTFGAAEAKNWTYLNLQERLQHKQFFAQVFYDKSNSGNDNAQDPNGTYYLRTGIPVVDQSSILGTQAQQAVTWGRTKFIAGGEYLATRPQTEGTINGRNEPNDAINEYGGYLQTTTALTKQIDFLAAARVDANSRIDGYQFSPRAAIVIHPDENNSFRLTFNRAYSSPTSFSFFLDQYSGQTPAPGMPVQILGNPPKQGWTFARTCTGGTAGNLCMRSPYIPNTLAPASAAAAYAGFASQLQPLLQAAPASSIPGGEATRQALLQLLASPVGAIVRGLRPTDAQVGTVLVDLATKQPVTGVNDYAPLSADFSNTWEVGYKGFVGKRLGIEMDAWFQKRPADPTAQLINPGVLFNGQQLGAFLAQGITQGLIAAGQSPQVAQATAAQAAPGLALLMAGIPVGATAFTNSLDDQPYLVFSYQKATGSVNVHGFDVATDLQIDDRWSVAATYSNLNKNVFPDAPGATAVNPLAANTPKHRATATVRYERSAKFSANVRGRYADAFPVNSGVFNSYNVGTPIPYPPVPVNAFLDAGFSWELPVARAPRWSVTATNLLDNKVATFVGVPKIGRLLLTRLQYTY